MRVNIPVEKVVAYYVLVGVVASVISLGVSSDSPTSFFEAVGFLVVLAYCGVAIVTCVRWLIRSDGKTRL